MVMTAAQTRTYFYNCAVYFKMANVVPFKLRIFHHNKKYLKNKTVKKNP